MKKLLLSLIAAALLLTGCIQATTDPNQGTGYISGSSVNVSSELNGKIAEVFVEEGQTVEAGDLLFRLEDAILIAQKNQAEAGLATAKDALEVVKAQANAAQLQYDLAVDGAHAADMPARLRPGTGRPRKITNQPGTLKKRANRGRQSQSGKNREGVGK